MSQSATIGRLTPPLSEQDHVQGPEDAPVTLVEYGDFECPFCGDAFGIITEVRRRLGDRLRFAFRHFPVARVHPYAQLAAEASEAAHAQGSFWAMHDFLFAHQPSLEERSLVRYADVLGLNIAQFESDLRNRTFSARVREDLASGERSGVTGTPTFFINGELYEGQWDLKGLLAALSK